MNLTDNKVANLIATVMSKTHEREMSYSHLHVARLFQPCKACHPSGAFV